MGMMDIFYKAEEKEVEINGHKFLCRGLSRLEYEEIQEECAIYDVNMNTGQITFHKFSIAKMKELMILRGVKIDGRKITKDEVKRLRGDVLEKLYRTVQELTDLPEDYKKKFGRP